MIAYTALLLFIIGIFCLIRVGVKTDKILSIGVFFSVSAVFLDFLSGLQRQSAQVFSFVWNSAPSGDIKFDIVSNYYNYELILPFFLLTLITIGNNALVRYEERKNVYNALLLFNVTALMMMVTSNNFVQLLSMLFIVDILAAFVGKKIRALKEYSIANMVADMMIFMVLAVINGRVDSLDMREILNYKSTGRYLNFITVIGLTAVLIKFGIFIFQFGIISLRRLRLHRLQSIMFLFSPAAALVLLLKFSALWSASPYFNIYLNAACIFTLLWGMLGLVISSSLRGKMIYMQMMFWGVFIELLRFSGFVWNSSFTALMMCFYLFSSSIYLIYVCANREDSFFQITKSRFCSGLCAFLPLLIQTVTVAITADLLEKIYNNSNRYYIWSFAVLFVLGLSNMAHQTYFSGEQNTKQHRTESHKYFVYALLPLVMMIYMICNINIKSAVVWGFTASFLALTYVNPLTETSRLYEVKYLQKMASESVAYGAAFNNILQYVGRLLWILIDWKLLEKFIIGTTIVMLQRLIRIFRSIHSVFVGRILFAVIAIAGILLFAEFTGGKN